MLYLFKNCKLCAYFKFQLSLVKYEFKITPTKETFDNARILCKSIQGDLITTNLKHEGDKYHELVYNNVFGLIL